MAKGSRRTLYDKVWESHTVDILPTGQTQLFVGLHLIHEITTAPAFDMLREKGLDVAFPERTFATVDHIVPTDMRSRPFLDSQAEELIQVLEKKRGAERPHLKGEPRLWSGSPTEASSSKWESRSTGHIQNSA